MSKFKVGDKVKIPKTKNAGLFWDIDHFKSELIRKNYSKDYLLVETVDYKNNGSVSLEFDDDEIKLFANLFLASDLELYEKKSIDTKEPININLPPIELLDMVEHAPLKSNNKERIKEYNPEDLIPILNTPESKCDIWKRLIFAYADENNYNAVKEIATLADGLK